MSIKIISAAQDEAVNNERRATAARVIEEFEGSLPELRVVVLLDGWDWADLKSNGEENRGLFSPINKYSFGDWDWPFHLREELAGVNQDTFTIDYLCDAVIYLHNSSCLCTAGLTMTLAHEIQHLIQYADDRVVWAYNEVVTNLKKGTIRQLKLAWPDIPIEREARIVAKRVCESIIGIAETAHYIEERLTSSTLSRDMEDWRFIKNIDTRDNMYDRRVETGKLYRLLTGVRAELNEALTGLKKYPEFVDLNLDDAFGLA